MSGLDIRSVLKPSAFDSIRVNSVKSTAYRPKSQAGPKRKINQGNSQTIEFSRGEPAAERFNESSYHQR